MPVAALVVVDAAGVVYAGSSSMSLLGWAGSLDRFFVSLGIAVGLCHLGASVFAANCVTRPQKGVIAVVALLGEPVLAVFFARGRTSTSLSTSGLTS